MKMLPESGQSLLVRLDFSDQGAWELLAAESGAENEDGCMANLDIVDDAAFTDAQAKQLRLAVPANDYGASVLFAADSRTLTEEGRPVIVIYLYEDRQPFRCAVSELWAVENNLNIANMDWEDFSENTGPDGVFRGFE